MKIGGKTNSRKGNSKNINIILITLDSLRADHLSCMGYTRNTTPHMDNLAKKGVMFTDAVSNGPSTPLSFPSILTSTYPLMYPDYPKISRARTLISELLKENGYTAAAFHSNPYLSRYYHYDRGFDVFEDFISGGEREENKVSLKLKMKIKDNIKDSPILFHIAQRIYKFGKNAKVLTMGPTLPYKRAENIKEKVIDWMEKNHEKFFLWMHFMDTHHPFIPPKEFYHYTMGELKRVEYIYGTSIATPDDIKKIIELYDATIKYVDRIIGELFEYLRESHIWEETLIFVTADHGEEFMEHGEIGHMAKLYEELIHVPLIMKGPSLPSGIKINTPVTLMDILPTIMDYLGLYPCSNFLGESFLPLIKNKERHREGILSEALSINGKVSTSIDIGHRLISYRTKEWKYIYYEKNKKCELFNLVNDPKEKENLCELEKGWCKKFNSEIKKHILMEEKTRYLGIRKEKIVKIAKNLKR